MLDLQQYLITIGKEKRTEIFNGILDAGIANEVNKNKAWKQHFLGLHSQSSGKLKKIYKALSGANAVQIEMILRGLENE